MSLRLNGMAWRTSSGSSSLANVLPLWARASPNLLMAYLRTEQPEASAAAKKTHVTVFRMRVKIAWPIHSPIRSGRDQTTGATETEYVADPWPSEIGRAHV